MVATLRIYRFTIRVPLENEFGGTSMIGAKL